MSATRRSSLNASMSRSSSSTSQDESFDLSLDSGVDFAHFFSRFPLCSSVAQYLSQLDLDTLLTDLQLAITPMSSVPCYCRGEAMRRRERVRAELTMLEDAFADVERKGVNVGSLREDLRIGRLTLDECIRNDEAWSDVASDASSPASSGSFDIPHPYFDSARSRHRRSASDPTPPPMLPTGTPTERCQWSSHRRMSAGSAATGPRPAMHFAYPHAGHVVYPVPVPVYYPVGAGYAGISH